MKTPGPLCSYPSSLWLGQGLSYNSAPSPYHLLMGCPHLHSNFCSLYVITVFCRILSRNFIPCSNLPFKGDQLIDCLTLSVPPLGLDLLPSCSCLSSQFCPLPWAAGQPTGHSFLSHKNHTRDLEWWIPYPTSQQAKCKGNSSIRTWNSNQTTLDTFSVLSLTSSVLQTKTQSPEAQISHL